MVGESSTGLLPDALPNSGDFEQLMTGAGFDPAFVEAASIEPEQQEPFGTKLAMLALEGVRGTGGPTGDKGGGNYDDYATQDE